MCNSIVMFCKHTSTSYYYTQKHYTPYTPYVLLEVEQKEEGEQERLILSSIVLHIS